MKHYRCIIAQIESSACETSTRVGTDL